MICVVWGVILTKATVVFFKPDPTDTILDEARWWAIGFALLGVVFFATLF